MDINEIKKMLPHRYPFLLVDRVLEIEPKQRIVALKNVTANEEFFNGHFPAKPVMPGVLIIEALAQSAGILMLSQEEHKGKIPYFTGIDNARFRKTIVPGDQIIMEIEVIRLKGSVGKVHAVARVDNQVATEADLMFVVGE
ncbi:3-hydroxyacyl-[acyl-carrier-protein] dehydratase [Hydrogenispora ethanolica]|jgi:3-hydroxyacyl-[acyl-carrier-protein] dehydratase|uniref:3-hydroxyacyl-[acyl-carrier-protein] dehydratase FabZ n=1 Tax=Hydrogenispora ethanolica TaxID=1082276 RepID=A0A4R1RD55_HYDET|nr:3-hydroxyacyl-ACP dehydratase FabZ [Hydrogenispora ethanolica]TCL63746.1 3-hydroxyacyl-[acyl-carrier-protein] dehydratase [Hydrogenispora ethanolica]